MWYAKLDDFLKSQGFDNIDPDACLYLLMDDGEIIIVLVYVDDLLLVASSLAAIYKIKDALHKRFEMKDLGEAKVILGLEIRRDKALGTLKLSQAKNVTQVLRTFDMAECNPIGTPRGVHYGKGDTGELFNRQHGCGPNFGGGRQEKAT